MCVKNEETENDFLFCGKREDGKMVIGFPVVKTERVSGEKTTFILRQEPDTSCIDGEPVGLRSEMTWHPVDPKSVKQIASTNDAAARPIEEWHEDFGFVLWWKFPIEEPPYVGCPLDEDWPGYHTHWTPIPIPTVTKEEVYTATGSDPDVRGRWLLERDPDGKPYCFHCSVCDSDFSKISNNAATNYCPDCGKKMNTDAIIEGNTLDFQPSEDE